MTENYTLFMGNKAYSSWSLRAWWWILQQAGIEFKGVVIPLERAGGSIERMQSTTLFKYSPSGKVPVLQCDDGLIWDSLAITEYIAEKYPAAKIWPGNLAE